MLGHAQSELPHECCGLLAGRLSENAVIEEIYPLVNVAETPATEYLSEAQGMFAAHRDMRRRGLDVLAVYHSHPTAPPVPSKKDRERNYSPEVVNFIISLQKADPEMRGWWLTPEDFREAVWRIGGPVR